MALIPPDAALRLRLQTETNTLQPVQPVRSVPADLPELQAGQAFTARIVETLPDNTYRALVAGRMLTLSLPQGARTGDTLELVVTDRTAHGIVAQRAPQGQPTVGDYPWANFSRSGQMIAALLPREGERPPAAPLNRGAPLLPQPPASGAELAPALSRAVRQSGLFYESHQAQWIGGRMPVTQLLAEPQGALSNVAAVLQRAAQSAQGGLPSASPQALPGTAATQPSLPATSTTALATGAASASPLPPATVPGPAATAASAAAAPESATAPAGATAGNSPPAATGTAAASTAPPSPALAPSPTTAAAATGTASTGSQAAEADRTVGEAAPASTAAQSGRIIADELRPLVQQQLEALGTQRLIWHGELWPRQSVELEMHREEVRERAADGSEDYGERWNTTLRLQLPRLGEVGAALSLTGRQLRLALLTPYERSAADLRAAVPHLHEALTAAGIELVAVQIRGQSDGAAGEGVSGG